MVTQLHQKKIYMLSRYLISIQILLSFIAIDAFAQRSNHFGIDVSKTLSYNVLSEGSGFVIEPVYLYLNDSSLTTFKLPLGFSSIKCDNVYSNSNIETTGYYIKPGFGISVNKRLIPYMNILLTNYNIKNTYVLEGNYHGDYVQEYTHNNLFAFGIEPNIDMHFELKKQLSLILSSRLTYIIYNSEDEDFPAYYIPGAGVFLNKKFTVGLNIYIVW